MYVIKHKCRQGYESTIIALEIVLSIGVYIIMIQELFICN